MGMSNQLFDPNLLQTVERTVTLMLRNLGDTVKPEIKWVHNPTPPQQHITSLDLKIKAGLPALKKLAEILSAEHGKLVGEAQICWEEHKGVPVLVLHQDLHPQEPTNHEAVIEKNRISQALERILEQRILLPRAHKILHDIAGRMAASMACPTPQTQDITVTAEGNNMVVGFPGLQDDPLLKRLRQELAVTCTIRRTGLERITIGDQHPVELPGGALSLPTYLMADAINKLAANHHLDKPEYRMNTPIQPDGKPPGGGLSGK